MIQGYPLNRVFGDITNYDILGKDILQTSHSFKGGFVLLEGGGVDF